MGAESSAAGRSQFREPSVAICNISSLIECERAGNIYHSTLYASAPVDGFRFPGKCALGCRAGSWYAPCVDAHATSAACAPARREILVLTHMPKAGGSSLGESVQAALQARHKSGQQPHMSAPCRLFWNGRSARDVCPRVKEWISRRSPRRPPPLSFAREGALLAHPSPNSSLVRQFRDA